MEIEFNVDEILKEKKLSIRAASRICGISYPTMYTIAKNQQVLVALRTLKLLAEGLGVEIKDLFRETGK